MDDLVVERLYAGYADMPVVSDVSFQVRPGQLVCVVGRNGAGKTTMLLAVGGSRYSKPVGLVRLGERTLSNASPTEVFKAGLAIVPAGHRVFGSLSVLENLRLGIFPWRRARKNDLSVQIERAFELFPILGTFAQRPAGQLSGGQQQMVALAQAFVSSPKILLLDEPSSGLAPAVVDDIYRALHTMQTEGIGLLVVEQNVERALSEADDVLVMDEGRIAVAGRARDLAQDAKVADLVRGVGSS
jgi:branched-chain amino acid transport system ATP-binding protein